MSIFEEKVRAVKQVREFMRSLLDPKKTPRVSKAIRTAAKNALKHFPADYDIKIIDFEGKWKAIDKA